MIVRFVKLTQFAQLLFIASFFFFFFVIFHVEQKSSMKDILMDKEFVKEFGGYEVVPLTITYRPSDLNQNANGETEEISGEFVSIR